MDAVMKVRRRFVNLEGLEYAEEHDDITVGFDTEEGEHSSYSECHVAITNDWQIATGSPRLFRPPQPSREVLLSSDAFEASLHDTNCNGNGIVVHSVLFGSWISCILLFSVHA